MHAPPPDLIFVYGTLRRAAGHPAHRLVVEHGEFAGNGFVRGRLYDAGEYPGLQLEAAAGPVAGEVLPALCARPPRSRGSTPTRAAMPPHPRRRIPARTGGRRPQ